MLLINALKWSCQMLIGLLLWGMPVAGMAQEPRDTDSPVADASAEDPRRHSLGAPQVLELPPVQEAAPEEAEVPPVDAVASPTPPPSVALDDPAQDSEAQSWPPAVETNPQEAMAPRTYLGVLYATAEEGQIGVKVLDVIPGSPAARAGFEGVNTPSSAGSQVADAVIFTAAPLAGPFAPLIILPYAIYRSRQMPGDLIVGIGEQQVQDAASFGQAMHEYRVGDTVVFSVVRHGQPLQISVLLEEEPA